MQRKNSLPPIIQGGMGIAVSHWRLARTVSCLGQVGVVSGTAINSVFIRRLALGDPEGHMRKAMEHFPDQEIVERALRQYFRPQGIGANEPFPLAPMYQLKGPIPLWQMTVLAAFVEVWLAKQGHEGIVGINLLEKIQLPTVPTLLGAMLAEVDWVLMGAGIPREIPRVLDELAQWKKTSLKIHVENAEAQILEFDPTVVLPNIKPRILKRPWFFPIVSQASLAMNLKRKATGSIEGFIVEGPKAGGHNAPPRGAYAHNELGEPIYGPKDIVHPQDMLPLELPFYFAGDCATPEKLQELRKQGAAGIQVGTLFAFCEESGLDPHLRTQALHRLRQEAPPDAYGWVYTDGKSSPTGFPFKAIKFQDSLAHPDSYQKRRRICDLGYLRHLYQLEDRLVYRCPAEPIEDWAKKGGKPEDTEGKKCLCNALMADIGLAQRQKWGIEGYLLTAGDDFNHLLRLLPEGSLSYSAKDVIDYLLPQKL